MVHSVPVFIFLFFQDFSSIFDKEISLLEVAAAEHSSS